MKVEHDYHIVAIFSEKEIALLQKDFECYTAELKEIEGEEGWQDVCPETLEAHIKTWFEVLLWELDLKGWLLDEAADYIRQRKKESEDSHR